MEVHDSKELLHYIEKIHQRTRRVIDTIPPQKIEWRIRDGEFSFGDIIRHLANLQLFMFAENVQFKESSYPGHDVSFAQGYQEIVNYFEDKFNESFKIFQNLKFEEYKKKCKTPGNVEIRIWKWLRSMIEHEVHHRGQMYLMLNMLNLQGSPLYGLTSEEVKNRSRPPI